MKKKKLNQAAHQKPRKQWDETHKFLFADAESIYQLLQFVDDEWITSIRPENITIVSNEFIARELGGKKLTKLMRKISDIVAKISFRSGNKNEEKTVYIILEHQSTVDYSMSRRLFFLNILQHDTGEKVKESLLIMSDVLYNTHISGVNVNDYTIKEVINMITKEGIEILFPWQLRIYKEVKAQVKRETQEEMQEAQREMRQEMQEGIRENARSMLSEGLSAEVIQRITGLSEDEIQAFQQNGQKNGQKSGKE